MSIAADQPATSDLSVIAEGKRSTSKRTAALAEKVEQMLAQLGERLATERRANSDAAREVAELERQLAQARRRLERQARGGKMHNGPGRGEFTCSECGHVSPTRQGLLAHARFNHKPFLAAS